MQFELDEAELKLLLIERRTIANWIWPRVKEIMYTRRLETYFQGIAAALSTELFLLTDYCVCLAPEVHQYGQVKATCAASLEGAAHKLEPAVFSTRGCTSGRNNPVALKVAVVYNRHAHTLERLLGGGAHNTLCLPVTYCGVLQADYIRRATGGCSASGSPVQA